MPKRRRGEVVNGILLLDKPLGLSSNKALQQAKKKFNAQKAGHTGSLDPLATGMLPICFGEATKVCGHLLDANKAYRAEITLGVTTSTEDGEGEIVKTQAVPDFTEAELQNCLASFLGEQQQIPPMHSAIWHEGKRLYKFARAGESVAVKPRQVCFHQLSLQTPFQLPKITVEVVCSKGTYIRALARDVGEKLGCGAYLSALHRTYVAPFQDKPLIALAQLTDATAMADALLPVDSALQHYPAVVLSEAQAVAIQQGRKLTFAAPLVESTPHATVRLYNSTQTSAHFLGLANRESDFVLSPKRLMQL